MISTSFFRRSICTLGRHVRHFHPPAGILCALHFLFFSIISTAGGLDVSNVIYAINAGGDAHTDIQGVIYKRDPLSNVAGISSDFGKQLSIQRVHPHDQILYQTERYHTQTFGYNIPIKEDGQYVIVLKFSEVYFNAPGQKVFDVVLNNDHSIVSDLDIYSNVGHGVAHDEMIPFTIADGMLKVQGEETNFEGSLRVDFIKGSRDNPKINAILVIKGGVNDVPPLAPIKSENEHSAPPKEARNSRTRDIPSDDDEDEAPEKPSGKPDKKYKTSGPKAADPYAADDTATLLPLLVAIGAFIPLLFCLCKL